MLLLLRGIRGGVEEVVAGLEDRSGWVGGSMKTWWLLLMFHSLGCVKSSL